MQTKIAHAVAKMIAGWRPPRRQVYDDVIAHGVRYEQRLADECERHATVHGMHVTADDTYVWDLLALPEFESLRRDPVSASFRKWRKFLSQFGDELERRALCGTPLRLATVLLVDPSKPRSPNNYRLVPRIVWACTELVRCRCGLNDVRAAVTLRVRDHIRDLQALH